MEYNKLNLRELTVYDLCDDENYLKRYFPFGKDVYLQEVQKHPDLRWKSMLSLSEETGYEDLEESVEKQFADEIAACCNE